MTTQQALALVAISAFVIGLFAYAYWLGRQEGLIRGKLESDRAHHAIIEDLEASLDFLRNDHERLQAHSKKLEDANALQEHHYHALVEIGEALRIATETWGAFRTGKKLERDGRRLRFEALAMANILKPADQEAAA